MDPPLCGSTAMSHNAFTISEPIPTVSPLLTPITSRNVLLLQSLPNSIPYRQDNVRRRKDDTCVGTATRSIVERLSRVPGHLPSEARSSRCVRRALSAGAGWQGVDGRGRVGRRAVALFCLYSHSVASPQGLHTRCRARYDGVTRKGQVPLPQTMRDKTAFGPRQVWRLQKACVGRESHVERATSRDRRGSHGTSHQKLPQRLSTWWGGGTADLTRRQPRHLYDDVLGDRARQDQCTPHPSLGA